jgi:hypothetical protein
LTRDSPKRPDNTTRDLLAELAELRDLDRTRNAQPPGSAEHEAASAAVDALSKRVMNRSRDVQPDRVRGEARPSPQR